MDINSNSQKHLFADVLQNRFSLKFPNIHGKTPVLEFLFNKKKLQHKCLPVNIAKFLRTAFFIEYLWWLLLNSDLRLAMQILTKQKEAILIIAMQTK